MMHIDIRRLRTLGDYLTSEALCDALAELGSSGYIPGMRSNWKHAGFFGPARTMRLRELREGEDPDGIYGALESYEEIGNNDVIVVESEAPQFAYFGELNAILAKREGAAGAVIGGRTRDIEATVRMRFPVFAKGYCPYDCKGYLTLESIGESAIIGGIRVAEGDLVFADSGGVVALRALVAEEAIRRAVEAVAKEHRIRRALLDSTIQEAIAQHGTF